MWEYVVKKARKGKKIIPLIETKCDIGERDGKRYAFLKSEPQPIYSADTVHFRRVPENLAFEIESIIGNEVIIKTK